MESLYFAYGSNLDPSRLAGRVGRAEPRGAARLAGHRLAFDKPGRDGSAKANLRPQPGGLVWGVVYALDPDDWARLDRFERGYDRVEVSVDGAARSLRVQTYRAARSCAALPFAWYLALCVAGARQHGLPRHWVEQLRATPVQPDPSCEI